MHIVTQSWRAFIAAISASVLLNGCALPKIGRSSPEITGRVVDLQTREPVTKARVALRDHQQTWTETDATGTFHLSATHQLYWTVYMGCVASDLRQYGSLEVSHPQYESAVVDTSGGTWDEKRKKVTLKDSSITRRH